MTIAKSSRMKQKSTSNRIARRARPTTAVVVHQDVEPLPWQLTPPQITLLKNYLHLGDASEIELQACLEVARRYRLDPFKPGQIWFVKRWDSNADNGRGGTGALVRTPQVGIYGLANIAARDHADYGTLSLPEYGPIITVDIEGHKIKAPEWARVKAFKKGVSEPSVGEAYFEEFCPSKWKNAELFWAKMQHRMIAKCAKAQALREAYPDLGGLYIPEEMDRMRDQYTEGGRRIVSADGDITMPTLDENARHGHAQGSRQAEMAESTLAKVEAEDKRLAEERAKEGKKVSPSPDSAPQRPLGTIELDFSSDPAYLRGDLSNLLELIKKHTKAYWDEKEQWWRISASEAPTIREMCKQCNYALREIKASEAQGSAPEKKRPAERAGASSAEPRLVTATVERANIVLKGNKTMCFITLQDANKKKLEAGCWDKDIYERLEKVKGKGMACQIYIELRGKYTNIVGLKFIGSQEFVDGKTPVIQNRDREPGKTLF